MFARTFLLLTAAWHALAMGQLNGVETSLGQSAPAGVEAQGIEATYCFNLGIPSMDQTAAVYVRYVVLPDEWVARVEWDAGFINGMFSPVLADTTLHKKAGTVVIARPHVGTEDSCPIAERSQPIRYDLLHYPLRNLASSLHEAQVWRHAADMSHVEADGNQPLTSITTTPFSAEDAVCRTEIHRPGNSRMLVRQTVNDAFVRTQENFRIFSTESRRTFASRDCIIHHSGRPFAQFNEGYLGQVSGSRDQQPNSPIQPQRGGR